MVTTDSLDGYARQTRFSDPGQYAALFDPLPGRVEAIGAAARNVIVHYYYSSYELPPSHLSEVDSRWMDRILACDQARFPQPLRQPRPPVQRVAGCCRDFTLFTVSGLRHHGVPARSRIGFASYLMPDVAFDHVITEYWDGDRWVWTDTQLEPETDWGVDPADLPRLVDIGTGPCFATAAQVWTAYRRGDIDDQHYGVGPGLPPRGAWLIRNYVIKELAHRFGDELLLWDRWGAMTGEIDPEDPALVLVDEIAALLLASDRGDEAAEAELARRYAADSRLHPGEWVLCRSPVAPESEVDLATRATRAPR